MTNIVKPEKMYVPKFGDVNIYGEHHEYLEAVDWELFRTMNPMPIQGAFSNNPWMALKAAGIDDNDVENLMKWSTNHCPCSDMDYFAIVPIVILTSDATRYLGVKADHKVCFYDMLIDEGWNRYQYWGISNDDPEAEMPNHDPNEHMGAIVRAMLGSGYNDCILPSDGGHDFIFAAIPLDNGDKVIIIGWEWYNK